ncbi:hypothetical protein H9X85_02590 [Anaerotignum lactatifermentans]|uniref:DUF4340 domain-containing protein n=1 Tax=Anaerotignum lactatifermentans TaxID=160404 RepID=A0ABS2GBL4_9FIRM|nr:hypothetical protein [Anaerotignum lactatifermentans]MBM6828521.1 hypothetical protein [Anaerotignum lactatifermentans]MBM6877928.1 hypothetical protein [Anaerotignum lactatifermentans]MBM6950103.1 hypothetical protein [Anaerotignum lactatifermentans]
MKKKGWKAIIGVIVIVIVIAAVYQLSKPQNFSRDMEQLRTLAESGSQAYTVEAADSAGNKFILEDSSKDQLTALILSTVTEGEGAPQEMPELPALTVKITGADTSFEAKLTVYDQGEATNEGILQTTNDTYAVENCGEVFNYLAELGLYTER